jgi:GGDEF-like domain/PucR C-terminal helix-turn-helix domain
MPETGHATALRELARQLRPRAQALAEHADMAAVSLAALNCWLDVLEQRRPVDDDLLRPVLDVIRRGVLQGIGVATMMRACRLAVRLMWEEILELPVSQDLVAPLSSLMLEFTDRLATAAELSGAPHEADLLEAVLSDRTPENFHPATWLPDPHCVVIAETTIGGTGAGTLADLTAALARETRAAYWTTRSTAVVAACPIDGADGRDVLIRHLARFTNATKPLSVAVGGVAHGPTGTRMSYREALEAMRAGRRLSGGEGRIHDSQELAPLVSLVRDPEPAMRFAEGCLYPLGRLAERGWVLPTLAAYLKCQGKLKEIALELAVHPSTVKYRLNELRPFLDAHVANGDQAAALLLAVRVSEYFAEPEPRG